MKLGKEEHNNPNSSRRKKTIKKRTKISEIENIKTIEKISEIKS